VHISNIAENDFLWISQGKVATADKWGRQMQGRSRTSFILLRWLHRTGQDTDWCNG